MSSIGITKRKTFFFKQSVCASAALLTLLLTMQSAVAGVDLSDPVLDVVRRHIDAQRTFDLAAIKVLTTDNYIEVSPAGEMDLRDKMLGFYSAENKSESPTIQIEEPVTRHSGDTAVVIARLVYSLNAGGQMRNMAMRATFVAQKSSGAWKLLSSHYTAIRPTKTPA